MFLLSISVAWPLPLHCSLLAELLGVNQIRERRDLAISKGLLQDGSPASAWSIITINISKRWRFSTLIRRLFQSLIDVAVRKLFLIFTLHFPLHNC